MFNSTVHKFYNKVRITKIILSYGSTNGRTDGDGRTGTDGWGRTDEDERADGRMDGRTDGPKS